MSHFAEQFAENFAKQLRSMIELSVGSAKKNRKKKILLKEEQQDKDSLSQISVSTESADIDLVKSSDSIFRFQIFSTEEDDREKFEIQKSLDRTSFDLRLLEKGDHNLSVKIFLPENLGKVIVFTKNGDIVANSISGILFSLKTENGDINCNTISANSIEAKSTNGDIIIKKCKTQTPIKAISKNGDVLK